MPTVLEISQLPEKQLQYYNKFVEAVAKKDTQRARYFFRPLIEYYTSNNFEVPKEIETNYGMLYVIELQEEE